MARFLGIDVGTSSVKVVVIDGRGRAVARASEALAMRVPEPGWAEQDPVDWWKAAARAIRRALANDARGRRGIDAVGLSGQMHSSVFLDRKSQVIRPALLWCDVRTAAECRAITARVGENALRSWVSNPALEGFTLPKILWLRDHEPAAFRRLAKVLLPKDFVRLQLTGAMGTELSDASGTLLLDVANRRWSREMLDAMSLSPALLPELGRSTEVLGTVSASAAKSTGLAAGTPVVGGGADNACGAIGVGVVRPGTVVASWGTSGTVLCPTAAPKVDPRMRAHTFCHAVPDTWYVMGVMLTAGGAFEWYKTQLAPELARAPDVDRRLDQEAARAPIGALGLTFLPYLQGERTPHRDADARGAFVGLSLAHTRAHMTRAVLEGICFGLRDSLEIVASLGLDVEEVRITGGGAGAAFVRQLQADVYGKPVVPVEPSDGPAFGAALLAAVGVRAFGDVTAAAATVRRRPSVRPRPDAHRGYEAAYRRFRDLYPALRAGRQPPADRSSSLAAPTHRPS
jgi:xylulokinase